MVKLSDYGIELIESHSERISSIQNKAPEAFKEKRELKSDVWSFGITLIELAERRIPYDGSNSSYVKNCICDNDPPSLSSEKWSTECVDFIRNCLVKDVNERWSVKQLMEVGVWEMA